MKTWYFTFRSSQENAGYCQPIQANSCGEARQKMFDVYGEKWAFQYSEEKWNELKNDKCRWWDMEIELPIIKI